jgi:hypothetical protein
MARLKATAVAQVVLGSKKAWLRLVLVDRQVAGSGAASSGARCCGAPTSEHEYDGDDKQDGDTHHQKLDVVMASSSVTIWALYDLRRHGWAPP